MGITHSQAVSELIGSTDFQSDILESDMPVLVDFWAPWCMPCLIMAPVLDELALEFTGKLKIAKINTEEPDNQKLAIEYQIRSIPNMKLFYKGQVVEEFEGAMPKEVLRQQLISALSKLN